MLHYNHPRTRGELNPSSALGAICTRFATNMNRPGVCPPAPTIGDNLPGSARPEDEDVYITLDSQSLAGMTMSNTTSSKNSTTDSTTYNYTAPDDAQEPSSAPSSEPSSLPSSAAPTSAPTDFVDDLAPDSSGQHITLFWQASLLLLTVLFL